MKLEMMAVGLALALGLSAPAQAQRPDGKWELLGEQKVGFGVDRDVINVGQSEEYFRSKAYRSLRFVAQGGEVKMKRVRLVYLNGSDEELQFEKTLSPGEQINVELRGERSYLSKIEMFYGAKFGVSFGQGGLKLNQPSIKVFGENVWRRREPEPPPPPIVAPRSGWPEIGRTRFDRTEDRAEVDIGHRDGRVGQIRLRLEGEPITLKELRIRFRNGENQIVTLDKQLTPGEETRAIDLDGDKRRIERIILKLEPRKRPGPVEVMVLGQEEPGNEDRTVVDRGYRRSWIPLGEQSVGFGIDRDVIKIGQSEEWYRNRGFDKLHFVAGGNDVHMIAVRVVYLNGASEDYRIDQMIRAGSDLAVDLPGSRSYLREIQMTYRSRPGFAGQATMKVYGEPPPRRRD